MSRRARGTSVRACLSWRSPPWLGTPGEPVTLAWLLAEHPWIVPIPVTTKRHRLSENNGAVDVHLTAEDLAELTAASDLLDTQGAGTLSARSGRSTADELGITHWSSRLLADRLRREGKPISHATVARVSNQGHCVVGLSPATRAIAYRTPRGWCSRCARRRTGRGYAQNFWSIQAIRVAAFLS